MDQKSAVGGPKRILGPGCATRHFISLIISMVMKNCRSIFFCTSVAINSWTTGGPGKRSAREFFSGAEYCQLLKRLKYLFLRR